MLKVQRSVNGDVLFTLSGQMDAESTAELETLLKTEAESSHIVLNLKDVTLGDQDAVNFLDRCEVENITLKNCPAYIREWITRQRLEIES